MNGLPPALYRPLPGRGAIVLVAATLGCGPTVASDGDVTETAAGMSSGMSMTTGQDVEVCSTHADCQDPITPVCADGVCAPCTEAPQGACAERSAELPACGPEGACVICDDTDASACPQSTPACEDFECRGCQEHAECPDSACHLSGDTPGACFSASEVVEVSTQEELDVAIAALADGDSRVIRLALPSSPSVLLEVDAEVALLGDSNVAFDQTSGIETAVRRGFVYGSGANFNYGCGSFSSLVGDPPPSELWVDDAELSLILGGGCQAHVRRSTLHDLFQVVFSELFVQSSVLLEPHARIVDGVADGWATVDIVASTMIGPMTCIGDVEVSVRNSIVLNSIIGETDIDRIECSNLSISYSATSNAAPGEGNIQVGRLDPSWFAGSVDFHLSDRHPFGGVARWQTGDPRSDIDGEPRSMLDGAMEAAGADLP